MNAAIPERGAVTEEISGLIERVTFHNDDSGFCVLRVKVQGCRDETTIVGSLPSVNAGEWLVAEGWWVRDKEHGLQFKATTDRKSTRLNSSHLGISYAVFCLKK